MTAYFGPEHYRAKHEVMVATPVGQPCLHCAEPIEQGEMGTFLNVVDVDLVGTLRPAHYECSMRDTIGSLAHQEGTCSCFVPGVQDEDPAGMTRHEAAILALALWQSRRSAP